MMTVNSQNYVMKNITSGNTNNRKEHPMQPSIQVTGVGKVIARPNLIVMNFEIITKDQDYDSTLEEAAVKQEQLRSAIMQAGVDPKDLKTIDFSINTNYIHEIDRTGNSHRIFDGYISNHKLVLELYFDMKLLSEVISSITKSKATPEYTISFTMKEKHLLTEELLVDAVENATKNAYILAHAANQRLGKVLSIKYDWSDIRPFSPTRYNTMSEGQARFQAKALDIVPEDIEVTDRVTMEFELLE